MTSTIVYPPGAKSGFAAASRAGGGATRDASCVEAARKPPGGARIVSVPGAAAPTVAVVSASGTGQTGQPVLPIVARRARLLREQSLVSPGGVLVFVVGLALIGVCTAIF